MDAFLTSTTLVAFAEIGDKTQLLAIILATRFKRPAPIIFGILFATLANHALAAFVGERAAHFFSGQWFEIGIAISFVAMAAWTLIPDKADDEGEKPSKHGPFLTTLIVFFLVEMGDKTQLATIALGAQFSNVVSVTAGSTLGMMIANVPAVLFGNEIIKRVPLGIVRVCAAALFLVLGVWFLYQALPMGR
jgi:Ca2+/H+ antiporter, TMEM165/GDT1 family